MGQDDYKKSPFHMEFQPFNARQMIYSQYGKLIPRNFKPHLRNNTLLRHTFYRQHRNQNTFILILGNVRSGKTYFALKMAELFMKEQGKKFSIKKQCSFDPIKFLKWSSTTECSCYVLDEIQLSMGAREWYDVQHRIFNQFADIQGFRRNCLFLTLPNIAYIDRHLRFLMNYVVRTLYQSKVIWWKVKMRHEVGKGWLDYVGSVKVSLPSKEVVDDYEAIKKIFNDEHLRTSIEILENIGKPKKRKISAYQIQQAFKRGIITEEVFTEKMIDRGFDESEVAIAMENMAKSTQGTAQFSHTCAKCGATWQGKKENPRSCPRCDARKWRL